MNRIVHPSEGFLVALFDGFFWRPTFEAHLALPMSLVTWASVKPAHPRVVADNHSFHLMPMDVLSAYVSVYYVHTVPTEARESIGSVGTGVTGSYKLSCRC